MNYIFDPLLGSQLVPTFGSSSSSVMGPGTSVIGDIAVWNNTSGTLLADSGVSFPIPVTEGGTGLTSTTQNQILYSSGNNVVAGLATANNGVLITSVAGVPLIGSTLPSTVQGNITTLGTISSGVWHGTVISPTYGGTGINNGSSTITLGGSLTTSGAFTALFQITANTNVIFPTSGTLATTSQIPTLPLSLANGGTNASLTASNGGIFYSTGTAGAILSGTATANQILMSGASTTPAWSTATYPAVATTANTFLQANGTNWVASTSTLILGGNLTTSGPFNSTFTMTAGTSVTFPTAGTLATTSQLPSITATQYDVLVGGAANAIVSVGPGSAGQVLQSAGNAAPPAYSTATYPLVGTSTGSLLRADGTNWSATTSTYPATNAINTLLYASSANVMTALATVTTAVLTTSAGVPTWASELSLALGGTNADLTASNGGIFYSTASAGAILSGTATAGQLLLSGASTTPAWSTSTYPATNAVSTLLYASSANVMGALATGNNGVLITSASGVPSWLAGGTTGQVLTATTSNPATWAAAPTGNLQIANVTLTNAQIKALFTTPVQIIATPGSGKMIVPVTMLARLNYGTSAFTAGASQSIQIYFNNTSNAFSPLVSNAMLISTASKEAFYTAAASVSNQAIGTFDNVNLAAWNPISTNISGNAGDDSTIDIIVGYYIVTL